MTLYEHLGQLVRVSPPGTLVPVASLAELLRTYSPEAQPAPAPAGLSLGEVAERFARSVGGKRKTVQEGTVRKWIRVGIRGVKLKAFRAGRYLRVLEPDLDVFVAALVARGSSQRNDVDAGRGMTESLLHPATPEAEIEAYRTLFVREPQRKTASSSGSKTVSPSKRRLNAPARGAR